MKQFLKIALIKTLALADAFPTRMTSRDELQTLLRKLYPQSTDRGLIRLGPKGDGGYLVPNDLAGIEACFSPGVSVVSGFEKDCADLGMRAFLADGSVDRPATEHELFVFSKKFIGVTSTGDFMTLDDWVGSSLPSTNCDLLLQIDIEGYEYEVFLSASAALMRRLRIIVVEFHTLDELWNRPFFMLARRVFERLAETHTCVHIHPNNCSPPIKTGGLEIPPVMEFTFLRSDRIGWGSYQVDFPHPLDCDNTPHASLVLPTCWRGKS